MGYDIDPAFEKITRDGIQSLKVDNCNVAIKQRLDDHIAFIADREKAGKEIKHFNKTLNVPVMTGQEEKISLHYIRCIDCPKTGEIQVEYIEDSDFTAIPHTSSDTLF